MSNVEAYNSALGSINLPYLIGYSIKVTSAVLLCHMYRLV